ncbi:hypothetical protein DH2020_019407 [Rehmannia glutinosa]|uniref:RCHY1 zinc-ribbon domain-containing protein n=1 Tax=Rehmannia glutinosa TaxID=99300 RepID=A0ABR0WQQ1_REHGL
MGGGESEKEEDWPAPPSVARARLVDAPVLFFVATHKAFRAELASIHRAAAEAAESWAACRELVVDLDRRLEFLRLVYNYHSASEDEVELWYSSIEEDFEQEGVYETMNNELQSSQLYALVKNVVPTYALEHKSIDDKFSSIFRHLDLLMKKDEDAPQMFQELLFSIGTVQTMICQHMHKEEEQVFPLLMQNFTSEEQSKLVWQYMCSVPTILLEEFLPWMTLHLTSEENLDVLHCIKLITPKEKILQEVVVSWIQHEERSSETNNICTKGYQLLNGLSRSKDIHELCPPQICYEREEQLKKACSVQISGVEGPIKGIYLWHAALIRDFDQIIEELYQIRSSNCSSSLSSVIFQIKFITDVLIFYSNSLDKFVYQLLSLLAKNTLSPCSPLIDECHIKGLQSLLFYEREGLAQLRSFIETLCQELESLVRGLVKNLMFLETEVFPSISESCTSEMQLWLLYTSLHMMPLGLLRCTVTWFSAHLKQCILWSAAQTKLSDDDEEKCGYPSSSISITTEEHDISYTFGMNHHKFFSQMFKRMPPLQKNLTESDRATFLTLESRPMDLVFYIHRALIKDMEYLVSLSAMLATNFGYLADTGSKGALQNISHSYCIDHKLETKHFSKTSIILNQISELHDHEGSNETRLKQYQLCLKLHDTCLSMHKVLSDHIHREEVEIFPLFRGCFSTEEEEKIIGHMLGVTRAEILQEKIPWLMAYLTSEEQNAVMSLWLKVARYTKFDEWLREWWEGMTRYNISATEEESRPSPSLAADPLEVVSMYLLKDGTQTQKVGHDRGIQKELTFVDFKHSGSCNVDESTFAGGGQDACQSEGLSQYQGEVDKKRSDEANERCQQCQKLSRQEHPLSMDQEDLEATIRRVSRDSNLDSQKKSYIIQNLLMSRWIITQKMSQEEASVANHKEKFQKSYNKNDVHEMPGNSANRPEMYEPILQWLLHGKVLLQDLQICAMQLANDNKKVLYYIVLSCKVAEEVFLLAIILEQLDCKYTIALTATCAELERGWALITSTDYTFSHYICPVCSKSLGDMQVYFGMLDALLAEEKIPEEYAGQTQVILCNDCEKRGTASFHWLYHKCPHCGSYNTRLL